jgi:hypothetical protein
MRLVEEPIASGDPPSGFDAANYMRQLKQASIEVQRGQKGSGPQAAKRQHDSRWQLTQLITQGRQEAEIALPPSERGMFMRQMRQIAASSGMAVGNMFDKANDKPPLPDGEPIKPDQQPYFANQWKPGDPQWRLLQCATKSVEGKVYIIGVAETSRRTHLVFHGVKGGTYKTTEMPLGKAQDMMSVAFQRGYAPVAPNAQAMHGDIGPAAGAPQRPDAQQTNRPAAAPMAWPRNPALR